MKLEKILDSLIWNEKLAFYKTLDGIEIKDKKKRNQKEKILGQGDGQIKNADVNSVKQLLHLVEDEFVAYVRDKLLVAESQMDILLDILIRDGNCHMEISWLDSLYKKELKNITTHIKEMKARIESGSDEEKVRDYKIYQECLRTAYYNDEERNEDLKVTREEQTILNTLANQLNLSQEEIKYINYQIIGLKKRTVDECMDELRNLGIAFYSKKTRKVYVADEVVHILRRSRGKEVADKHFRRVLKNINEPKINLICRSYNLNWKSAPLDGKIESIIQEGITLSSVLLNGMHPKGSNLTAIKASINTLIDKDLKLKLPSKGVTAEDKVEGLINYFDEIEREEKIGISMDGYDHLCRSLNDELPKLKKVIKNAFELQEDEVLNSDFLMSFNIKPRDLLYSLSGKELMQFCKKADISTRGDEIVNILKSFEDSDNLFIENYVSIGYRDLNTLKDAGIKLTVAEMGVKFETITKVLFERLGLNIDEPLRKKISDKKNKIDFVLNLDGEGLIIGECKSKKESGYNNFSGVSRQVKAYVNVAKGNGHMVRRVILVAPEFSDEFVNACSMSEDLEITLMTAETLKAIYEKFKSNSKTVFPYRLLTKDMEVNQERVLKAIGK